MEDIAGSRHPPTAGYSLQEAPRSLPYPPTAMAQAEALTRFVQATVATVLGPLVAELAASRQTNERQAQKIAELREDRGRLTAERDATQTQIASIRAAQTATSSRGEPATPVWRSWWLLALIVAGFVLLNLLLAWLW